MSVGEIVFCKLSCAMQIKFCSLILLSGFRAPTYNFLNGVSREKFSDLKLITECGSSLLLHRVVAAAISSKLSDLLLPDRNELALRNVKFTALENIIDFAYNGKVILSNSDDINDFADAFKLLEINLGPKVQKMMDNVNKVVSYENKDSSKDIIEISCSYCEKTFQTIKQLSRHKKEFHCKNQDKAEKSIYSCDKCKTVYTV